MRIEQIKVEYQSSPIGIDILRPRFSWKLISDKRDEQQAQYRICVALDSDLKEVQWDTKMTPSAQSIQVEYDGIALQSNQKYYYKIWVQGQDGDAGESGIESFETALLSHSEWQACWITPDYDYRAVKTACPILRSEFKLAKKVKKAKVYVTAKGLYELRLNGEKVGEDYLTPGWTSFNKHILYQTYDVTNQLKVGDNAVGTIIGSGWYKGEVGWRNTRNLYGGREAFIMEMRVQYEDGSEEVIKSNGSWKSSYHTMIEFSEIYHGETVDLRKNDAWDMPNYDDSQWFGVREMHSADNSILHAQECASVRVQEIIKPLKLWTNEFGETLIDMGQNMSGWTQVTVKGNKGDRVVLKHAEILDQDGRFYVDNLKGAKQQTEYILNDDKEVVLRPHFTYQGFRYVKIEEFPGTPTLDNFVGLVLYSGMEATGDFECSDEMVNQLQHNLTWSMKGNFVDIPTDCPQRCERLGWTADIQVFAPTAAFNMDIARFLTKWLRDLKADQRPDGGVPLVVPNIYDSDTYAYDLNGYQGKNDIIAAAWSDAATICPWVIYQNYGDTRILEEQYESMKTYIEYVRNEGDNPYLWDTGHQLGDWVALDAPYGSFIGATDVSFIATAYYAYSTQLFSKTAAILGNDEDAKKYQELHQEILKAFVAKYVTADGQLTVKTQTALILAVYFELVDESLRQGLMDTLAKILKDSNYDLITGFVGTPYICHVLSQYGYTDVSYKLLLKKDYPSWLYQITRGATTIWEHLDGLKPDGSLWNPRMNSFNHYAYGSVGEWLYKSVAGIKLDEQKPGYQHFFVRPEITDDFDYVKAHTNSMYGKVGVNWEKKGSDLLLTVMVPVNTSATVCFGDVAKEQVTEQGKALADIAGVREVVEQSELSVVVGSGTYNFEIKK